MSKVFFSVSMSLDGFVGPSNDLDQDEWWRKWQELQGWGFGQSFFRRNLQLGAGGETGASNSILEATFARTGVSIMGKRMFDAGEHGWPEEAPFHTPVFVLTQGGPLGSTDVAVYRIYQRAFVNFDFGYASALAWVLFIFIFAATLVQLTYMRKNLGRVYGR